MTTPSDLTPKQRRHHWAEVIIGAVIVAVSPLLMLSTDTASALPFAVMTGAVLITSGLAQLYFR